MSQPIIQALDTDLLFGRAWPSHRHLTVRAIIIAMLLIASPIAPFISSAYGTRPLTILREFGALYGAENKQHSGMDIEAENGEAVRSPVAGVVSFVGRVPGSAGLGIVAVTVETQAGDLVTLSPLARTGAKVGDMLSKGDTIGAVAATGDPSSADAHVHISMRVAGKYVDPASLVSAILSRATADTPSGERATVTEKATGRPSAVVTPALGHVEAAVDGVSDVMVQDTVPSTGTEAEPCAQGARETLEASSSASDSPQDVSVAHAILLEEEKAGAGASTLFGATGPKDIDSVKVVHVHDGIMVPSLSAGQLAVCIFLIGLSLTFAGVRVIKVVGGKSDLIGRFEHLAVRARR